MALASDVLFRLSATNKSSSLLQRWRSSSRKVVGSRRLKVGSLRKRDTYTPPIYSSLSIFWYLTRTSGASEKLSLTLPSTSRLLMQVSSCIPSTFRSSCRMDESQISSGVSEFPSNFFSMVSGSSLSNKVRVAGRNLWRSGAESRKDCE
jgi:hypothetical protein